MSGARTVLTLRISRRVARAIFYIGPWFFSALGLAAELLGTLAHNHDDHGIVQVFSLSNEANLPTLYQVFVLVAIAAMLALIARARKLAGERWHRQWLWLSIGFAYIAVDEFVSIHELLNDVLDLRGIFTFGWIVPYGIVALIVGIAFVPFVLALPRKLAARFVLAGTIYVGGAMGMEVPLGWWTSHHGMENLGYALIDWSEETLEMLGAGLFAASLLDVLRDSVASVQLELPRPDDAPGGPRTA